MKYNYLIIEDEKAALENLKTAMKIKKQYVLQGFGVNLEQGLLKVLEHRPDLIFLDVELGDKSGLDLIRELKNSFFELPPIIMTTAHSQYAKEAVNNQVLYFLSKPINPIELNKALHLFEKKYANQSQQLFVRTAKAIQLVKHDDIMYLKASGGYTEIYLNNASYHIPKPLKHFEFRLNRDFLRVHRSYIINVRKIKEISLSNLSVQLESNAFCVEVPISKDCVAKLRNHLKL